MGVTHMPRASPSHLVFKFACATQHVLDLIPEIDKKQLSDKHRGRLRARIEELTVSAQVTIQKKIRSFRKEMQQAMRRWSLMFDGSVMCRRLLRQTLRARLP